MTLKTTKTVHKIHTQNVHISKVTYSPDNSCRVQFSKVIVHISKVTDSYVHISKSLILMFNSKLVIVTFTIQNSIQFSLSLSSSC